MDRICISTCGINRLSPYSPGRNGGCFGINMTSYLYWNSHYRYDGLTHYHNVNHITCKTCLYIETKPCFAANWCHGCECQPNERTHLGWPLTKHFGILPVFFLCILHNSVCTSAVTWLFGNVPFIFIKNKNYNLYIKVIQTTGKSF